mgnify:CR=1 FL=1
MNKLTINLLGRFEVQREGYALRFESDSVRALLAWGGTVALLSYIGLTIDIAKAVEAFRYADHALFVLTLVLSTGRVLEGSLDAQGRVRIEQVAPGSFDLTFPRLDEEAWNRA